MGTAWHFLLLLALLVAAQTAAGYYYEIIPDLGALRKSSQPKSLKDASRECAADGGHLMVLDSRAKLNFLNQFINTPGTFNGASNDRDIWVGLEVNGGAWKTADGRLLSDVSFITWCSGRPADGTCAVYSRNLQCHWDGSACFKDEQKHPFICEKNNGWCIC